MIIVYSWMLWLGDVIFQIWCLGNLHPVCLCRFVSFFTDLGRGWKGISEGEETGMFLSDHVHMVKCSPRSSWRVLIKKQKGARVGRGWWSWMIQRVTSYPVLVHVYKWAEAIEDDHLQRPLIFGIWSKSETNWFVHWHFWLCAGFSVYQVAVEHEEWILSVYICLRMRVAMNLKAHDLGVCMM
jgi:hypothetical protein